jgi:FAD/FMN-containing dehydrogenase
VGTPRWGGNFGVVTEFEFALHPVGPQVQVSQLFWKLDDGAAALREARELCTSLSRDAGALIAASVLRAFGLHILAELHLPLHLLRASGNRAA